jgi:hypothetical protein
LPADLHGKTVVDLSMTWNWSLSSGSRINEDGVAASLAFEVAPIAAEMIE